MKILSRDTLLRYPSGTIFSDGKRWYFNRLNIKGDTIGETFYYRDLLWPQIPENSTCANDCFYVLDDSLVNGKSYKASEDFDRTDNIYDHNDYPPIYAVFEEGDLEEMIKYAKESLKITKEFWGMNRK